MKLSKLSLAFLLMMPASVALAQDFNASEMRTGLTMIETNVQNAFNQYGIDADPTTLTIAQLAEIVGVLDDPDVNQGGVSAKSQIEAALRRN